MQHKTDGNEPDTHREEGSGVSAGGQRKHAKRKHVGDETANPLPDDDYSSEQPWGDTTDGSPQGDVPTE